MSCDLPVQVQLESMNLKTMVKDKTVSIRRFYRRRLSVIVISIDPQFKHRYCNKKNIGFIVFWSIFQAEKTSGEENLAYETLRVHLKQ